MTIPCGAVWGAALEIHGDNDDEDKGYDKN